MPVFQDLSGRSAGRRSLIVRGTITTLVIVIFAVAMTNYARGNFTERFHLTIDAATVGEGLSAGADVRFRGLSIGRVDKITTVGYQHQTMELSLEPDQATELTDKVAAQFTSANVFGTTSIELVNKGSGGQLKDGTTLHIGADVSNVTVTNIMRRFAKLSDALPSGQFGDLLHRLNSTVDNVADVLPAWMRTLTMLADQRKMSMTEFLHADANFLDGADAVFGPTVELVKGVLDNSAFVDDDTQRALVVDALNQVGTFLNHGAAVLDRNGQSASKILDTVLDIAVPVANSVGTLAPSYNQLGLLIDRISQSLPNVDGRVQLQLAVILTGMPWLSEQIATGSGLVAAASAGGGR